MGEEDTDTASSEDTIILSAEDLSQVLEETPEDEKSKDEEDESS